MVNVVDNIPGFNDAVFDMDAVKEIHGNKIKDLLTKFFYRDSHLCFHILLHVDGGETVFFQEFVDYAEYKKAFSELQQAKIKNAIICVPKKNVTINGIVAKVA